MGRAMTIKAGLLPFLRSLGRQLTAEYDSINYGGCCVVAGYLALLLRHHTKVSVVVEKAYGFDQVVQSLDAIRSNTDNNLDPEEWHANGVGFYHVLVKLELDGYSYHCQQ